MGEHYDVLVRGGTVFDPANGVSGLRDVGLEGGRVAAVAVGLEAATADDVLDATGCYVVPGLIDLHTHVYRDVSVFGIAADELCPRTGVTTAVDTGSAGWINYRGLERYIIDRSETRILAFVHLSAVGLPCRRGELVYRGYADPDACARVVREHPDTCLGVKIRLYRGVGGEVDVRYLLRLAIEAAEQCEKPLMVHISNSSAPLADLLPPLRAGDIVTHCFHGTGPACVVNEAGQVLPVVWDARDRGVLFDIGHGLGSFTYDVARKALEDGFPPDTISTDIHTLNINGPVYDLPTTMSKFLNLGMPLEDVIRRSTTEPARAIGRLDGLGHLGVGAEGDVTVLACERGRFDLRDVEDVVLVGEHRLVCRASVRNGCVWYRDDGGPGGRPAPGQIEQESEMSRWLQDAGSSEGGGAAGIGETVEGHRARSSPVRRRP